MIIRILLFLLGIFITSIGLMYLLIYISLFGSGINIFSYLFYFISRVEIYLVPFGLLILIISICFDYKWHKFIKYRKKKINQAKKYYKELIENDK